MARRRSSPRAARGQTTVSIVQIAMLGLLLAGLLLFRDKISLGAGNFFGAMSAQPDLKLPPEQPAQPEAKPAPPPAQ